MFIFLFFYLPHFLLHNVHNVAKRVGCSQNTNLDTQLREPLGDTPLLQGANDGCIVQVCHL